MNFTSLHTHGFNMSYEEDDLGERGCSQHPRGEIAGGIRHELACFVGDEFC
jgi:hypothetical protein